MPHWPEMCHTVTPSASKILREYLILQSLECAGKRMCTVPQHLFFNAVLWEQCSIDYILERYKKMGHQGQF